jgi:hypothetical protein
MPYTYNKDSCEDKNADIIIPSEHVYWSNRKCRDLKSNYIETVLFYFQGYTEVIVYLVVLFYFQGYTQVIVYLAVLFYFQGYTEVIVYLTDINDNSPVFTQNSYNGKIQVSCLEKIHVQCLTHTTRTPVLDPQKNDV